MIFVEEIEKIGTVNHLCKNALEKKEKIRGPIPHIASSPRLAEHKQEENTVSLSFLEEFNITFFTFCLFSS